MVSSWVFGLSASDASQKRGLGFLCWPMPHSYIASSLTIRADKSGAIFPNSLPVNYSFGKVSWDLNLLQNH